MGGSQSQSSQSSPSTPSAETRRNVATRSQSLRGFSRRTSSNDSSSNTERSVSFREGNNRIQHRSRSRRSEASRPSTRHSLLPRQPGTSSSGDSSPESGMPSATLLQRLRRLRLDEDYDFFNYGDRNGSLSSSAPAHTVSVPAHSFSLLRQLARIKCPLCSIYINMDDLEDHMKRCVKKPRVHYNVDTLSQSSGECSICLETMIKGEKIARLPCLCVYHVTCLEMWYKRNQTCPEHPESLADAPLNAAHKKVTEATGSTERHRAPVDQVA